MASYDRHQALHEGAEGRILVHPARLTPAATPSTPPGPPTSPLQPPSATPLALPAPLAPAAPADLPVPPILTAPLAPAALADMPVPSALATPPTCARWTPTAWPSLSSTPTPAASAPIWWPATPASSCTTGASVSASSPATPPSTPPAAALPTPWPRPWSPGPTAPCRMVLGTMGGDSQPQILLQILHRILKLGQSPGAAVSAGRWALAPVGDADGFSTWRPGNRRKVLIEDPASGWADELTALGHAVEEAPDAGFGHAHIIEATAAGTLAAAADPRSLTGAAAGL